MTAREVILAYLFTLLKLVPNATAYRSREAGIDREEGTAIVLEPEEEAVEVRSTGLAVRDLTILVTVIARGAVPDQTADQIMQLIHAGFMFDTTLDGRCASLIEHSTRWTFEIADQTAVAAEMRYRVRYQTRATDLTATL